MTSSNGTMKLPAGAMVDWNEEEVARRFREMSPERRIDGIAVASMATDYFLQVMAAAGGEEMIEAG